MKKLTLVVAVLAIVSVSLLSFTKSKKPPKAKNKPAMYGSNMAVKAGERLRPFILL